MIHCIYVNTKQKSKWHLISVCGSIEMANKDKGDIIQEYKDLGKDVMAEIQSFDSDFYIPEYLSEIKEQKQQYN